MIYVYYSPEELTIYFLDAPREDHGERIGTVSSLPRRPAFLVQAMMDNAGHHDITGLAFVHGPRPTPTQETPDEV